MKVLDTFPLGDSEYVMEQSGEPGAADQPTAALLTRPGRDRPLGSLQRLHTDAPELVLFDWVGATERIRLEAWEPVILEHAQVVWREHYDPADFPADDEFVPTRSPLDSRRPSGWRDRESAPAILMTAISLPLIVALIFATPQGTPRLVSGVSGAVVALGSVFIAYTLTRGLRRAVAVTWRLVLLAMALFVATALWIAVFGHLPGVSS